MQNLFELTVQDIEGRRLLVWHGSLATKAQHVGGKPDSVPAQSPDSHRDHRVTCSELNLSISAIQFLRECLATLLQ